MTRPKLIFLTVWMFLAHNLYAYAQSSPAQMDNYFRRVLVMQNKTGPSAVALKRRFGTEHVKPYNVWDCDDRAAYVAREVEKEGYHARLVVQIQDNGVAHRYVKTTAPDGSVVFLLRNNK